MKKKKNKKPLKCYLCDNPPTHTIMLELREKPGPPLIPNNVLRVACDIHSVDTSFDHWVPFWAFKKLVFDYKQQYGINLKKEYCSINIKKFK